MSARCRFSPSPRRWRAPWRPASWPPRRGCCPSARTRGWWGRCSARRTRGLDDVLEHGGLAVHGDLPPPHRRKLVAVARVSHEEAGERERGPRARAPRPGRRPPPSTAERREGRRRRARARPRGKAWRPSWRRRARAAARATRTAALRSVAIEGGRRRAEVSDRYRATTASGAERIVRRVRYGRASREALARARRLGPIAGHPRVDNVAPPQTVRARLRGDRAREAGSRARDASRRRRGRNNHERETHQAIFVVEVGCRAKVSRGVALEGADGSSALLSSGCHEHKSGRARLLVRTRFVASFLTRIAVSNALIRYK